jgi:FtsH-binding integral membrane protein
VRNDDGTDGNSLLQKSESFSIIDITTITVVINRLLAWKKNRDAKNLAGAFMVCAGSIVEVRKVISKFTNSHSSLFFSPLLSPLLLFLFNAVATRNTSLSSSPNTH